MDIKKEKKKEYDKKYRDKNKENQKIKKQEYIEKNKEQILEKQKEYYENNKDIIKVKRKGYYEKNKEIINEKRKKYYEENKEIFLNINKINYENNKEIIKEKHKEFYENNKEIILNKNKDYRVNNKDKINNQKKKHYEENKEIINENNREYSKEYYEKNKEKILENMKCRSCKLFQTNYVNNYLCSYCNPNKSTRLKTKELKVKKFLEENNYTFIHNKKCNLDNSCQTYYPDFLIDNGAFFIIIECDENAHSSYDKICEVIRENNICYALGLPCIFIRYNPDLKGVKNKVKEKILKSYIEYYKNLLICNNDKVYLFY
jgi:hypothetical protein